MSLTRITEVKELKLTRLRIGSTSTDFKLIKQRISLCQRLQHTHYNAVHTKASERIKFVDLLTRDIVRYLGPTCKCLALSYV